MATSDFSTIARSGAPSRQKLVRSSASERSLSHLRILTIRRIDTWVLFNIKRLTTQYLLQTLVALFTSRRIAAEQHFPADPCAASLRPIFSESSLLPG